MHERLIFPSNEPPLAPQPFKQENILDSPFNGERVEFALTETQRKAIRDKRDGGIPRLPVFDGDKIIYGYCDEPFKCPHLEVNHIQNQADGGEDDPRNLITIPKCIHVGVCPSGLIKEKYLKK